MTDSLTHSQRSRCMSRVRGKDTAPELRLRRWLWANGYRYRLYAKKLPGKPDIVFPGIKKVIFVHGCFWHKHNCGHFSWPKNNAEFWKEKINGNTRRDKANVRMIAELGWSSIIIWECELKKEIPRNLEKRIKRFLDNG